MKTRHFFLCCTLLGMTLICLVAPDLKAQYNSSIGIRLGGTTGVTGKYFYKPTKAVEGIVGTFGNGFSITGLLEKYSPIYNADGFYFYYGGGAHLAFYEGRDSYNGYFGRDIYHRDNGVGFGINGIVGIEYRLPDDIPIAISIDLKPFIEMGTGGYVSFAPDPSIGVKFVFR